VRIVPFLGLDRAYGRGPAKVAQKLVFCPPVRIEVAKDKLDEPPDTEWRNDRKATLFVLEMHV
jgi:hypothetical protein